MRIGSPRADDIDQIFLRDSLIRGGMDPVQAERGAAMTVLREKQARARASMPRTADGRPALGEQEAAFDSDMAMAMGQVAYGNGADIDNLAAAGTPIVMDREFGTSTPRPVVRTRVPGPVDSSGRSAPGSDIYDAEEAAAYEARTPIGGLSDEQVEAAMAEAGSPYRGGNELPSGQDRDMYARGMVPTYDPATGEIGYTVAYPAGDDFIDGMPLGAPGRLGVRPDLRQPVIDTATGTPIQDSHKYDKQVRESPLGTVEVYAPSPTFRRELQEREDRNRTRRLATRAGFTPESAAVMATSGEPQNLDQLRAMGDARRDAAKADRQQAVIRRAQARYNPLEYMNRDDISDWNRMVAANSLLGPRGYRGATPLDVQGAHNKQLTELGLRVAQGQGFQQMDPVQREALQQRVNEGKPVQVRAQEQVAAGAVNHPDVQSYAESIVADNYSSAPGVLGISSDFTDNEVELAAQRLSADTGMNIDAARARMRQIQADRRRNSIASSVVAWFYDQ